MRGEVVEYCNTMFEFADPRLTVSATSGVINQQGRPFTHGFEIHLEKATLLYESAVLGGEGKTLMPLTVLDNRGKVITPELGEHDAIDPFAAEIKEVVQGRAHRPSLAHPGRRPGARRDHSGPQADGIRRAAETGQESKRPVWWLGIQRVEIAATGAFCQSWPRPPPSLDVSVRC